MQQAKAMVKREVIEDIANAIIKAYDLLKMCV